MLNKAVEPGVEAFLADFFMYLVRNPSAVLRKSAAVIHGFGHGRNPVKSHPRHYFGMNEVLALSADFPNAFIWFAPRFLEKRNDNSRDGFNPRVRRKMTFDGLRHGVPHFSVDVQLSLSGRSITDSDRKSTRLNSTHVKMS